MLRVGKIVLLAITLGGNPALPKDHMHPRSSNRGLHNEIVEWHLIAKVSAIRDLPAKWPRTQNAETSSRKFSQPGFAVKSILGSISVN